MISGVSRSNDRLLRVLGAYYEAAGSGAEPDRSEWIARHPELASELAEFFAGQDRVRSMVAKASDRETVLQIPESIEGYRMVRVIARGGMGVVFEARQEGLNRAVAIKMVLGGPLASDEGLRRFRVEAEAVAALDHPGIVPIYEVGQHADGPFFSMKLMAGGTLADALGKYQEDPKGAAAIVAAISRAVDHAHRRGVLHRDLKPSNILLDADGSPHVADFGLACKLQGDSDLTSTGVLIGSPSYMAPEQATGRKGAVSMATDVYGLGAILYALLTGVAPFRGRTAFETLQRVREDVPERPRPKNPKVDRDLETICLKCLEKDPAHRYADAASLADDLDRWDRGEPILARPFGLAERAWRWSRRRPLHALAVGLAASTLVAATFGFVAASRAQANFLRGNDHFNSLIHVFSRIAQRVHDRTIPDSPQLRAMRDEVTALMLDRLVDASNPERADSLSRMDAGGIYQHLAELEFIRGRNAEGRRWLASSIELLERLTREQPGDVGPLCQLGQAHHILALRDAGLGQSSHSVKEHCTAASRAYEQALRMSPDDPALLNYLSWFLAISPDPSFRDPDRAIALARRAIRNPTAYGSIGLLNNLGVALYRAGRYEEAIEALEESARRRKRTDGFDGFFLAMAHSRLGDPIEARWHLQESIATMERESPAHHELILFRAEAESLCGSLLDEAQSSPK
ncbi:protein kinase domain-containing protein [Aquisphaera insulae]|uniref:serine/threonine-protein kinase n=1 Tax=Aquisphaera insulae TaxID=2712864 RepID=UPI0013E9C39B|nr:serine/threonine-protein kinase [Aquisphaera insulae]